MPRHLHSILLCAAVLLVLSGCSRSVGSEAPEINQEPTPSSAEELSQKKPPLDVEIRQAFVDQEDKLQVKVLVSPKTTLKPSKINVSVLGFKDGELIETQTLSVEDHFMHEWIKKGQTVLMPFSLAAADLSEYQVKCSWGTEAKSSAAMAKESAVLPPKAIEPLLKAAPPAAEPSVSVAAISDITHKQTSIPCDAEPCDFMYTLSANLRNQGQEILAAPKLAVGIVWVNEGSEPAHPAFDAPPQDGEEVIELNNVELEPGAKKRVRITIDRPIPSVPGGRFLPTIRLLQ